MVGSEYRWFRLHPLVRGAFLSLGLAAVCIACLVWSASPSPVITAATDGPVVAVTPAAEQRAGWPRIVLRLWFVIPQLLPRS